MAEGKERKKKAANGAANGEGEAPRAQPLTSGEILRAARMAKGLGLEEVSSTVHIRVAQLRAIEEGNLSGLPGMTYALGFVKSYATYLKVNSADVVQKFKAEHGGAPASAQPLHMPEPLAEGPQPNLVVIGVAVFFAVLVLAAWAIFSGGEEEAAQVAAVPPAPVVGTVTGITPQAPAAQPSLAGSNILGVTAAVPAQITAQPEAEPAQPPAQAEAIPAPPPLTEPVAEPAPAETGAAETPAAPVLLPVKPDRSPRPAVVEQPPQQAEARQGEGEAPPVIKIKRGKGRIVLVPVQSSWVEIRDAEGGKVLKQVLRPGDQFYVPDQPGLTLLTSNAGGLEVYVDGAKVQALGRTGEIVRGIDLNPDKLKVSRVKSKDRR